jgi:hypothetical protein
LGGWSLQCACGQRIAPNPPRPVATGTGNEFLLRRRIKAVASAPFANLRSIAWWPSPSTIASHRKPADGTERRRVERPFSDVRQNFFLACSLRKMKNLNAQLDGWLAMATQCAWTAATQRIVAQALAAGKARPPKAFSHTV